MSTDPQPILDISKVTEEILKSVNSQIEKKITDASKVLTDAITKNEEDIKKLAELGSQQQLQMGNLINTVNDIGKKVEGIPRISKAEIEKTGSGFMTLLDDED